MAVDPRRSLDIPFTETDEHPLMSADVANDEERLLCGGLVIGAATATTDDGRVIPVLVFRFAKGDGSGFYPPMLFSGEPDQLRKLPLLLSNSVETALAHAGVA